RRGGSRQGHRDHLHQPGGRARARGGDPRRERHDRRRGRPAPDPRRLLAVHRRPRAAGPRRTRAPRARPWPRPCTRFRGARLAESLRFASRVDARRTVEIGCRPHWVFITRGEPYKRRGDLRMKVRGIVVALVALLMLAIAVPASAGVGLNAYRANAKGLKQIRELKRLGFDLTEGQRKKGVEIVATKAQVRKLRSAGVRTKLIRTKRGRTALRAGAAQAAGGYVVWRPFARTDVDVSGSAGNPTTNIKTQMENLARRYPNITKLETIGHSVRGLPIYAMKVTKNADHRRDGSRPAVLYSAVQHAREWLAGETERRTLRLFLDNYGKHGTAKGTDGQPIEGVSS